MTRVHEESPGVKSSKRYYGAALIIAGGVVLALTGLVAVFWEVADADTALAAGKMLVFTGAALLGVGLFEFLGSSKSSDAGGQG